MRNVRIVMMLLPATLIGFGVRLNAQNPGTAFTYQGQLRSASNPAGGPHDLRFTLWTHATDPGSALGPVVCSDNVDVVGGLFTVLLDFGVNTFVGFPLWLGIEVRADTTSGNCAGGAYELLTPRQQLTSTPYAIYATNAGASGLRLPFDGEANVAIQGLLDLENTRTTSNTYSGIFRVRSPVDNSRAVTGLATGLSGQTYGVWGESSSSGGVGVYGESAGIAGVMGRTTASTGTGHGVHGETASANGYAGYFVGGRNYFSGNVGIGVTNPSDAKLQVEAADSAIQGRSLSLISGAGVYGNGRYGIYGIANDTSGFGGVFGGAGPLGSGNSLWVSGIARMSDKLNVGGTSLTAPLSVRLQVENGDDAALGSGGYAVLGSTSGINVAIDNNEIMCRNNGLSSTLFLNNNGGNVHLIQNGIGNVGIGTGSPQQKLDVNGNIRAQNGVYFGSGVNPGGNFAGFMSFANPGNSEDFIWYGTNAFFFQDSPGGGDTSDPELWAANFITFSDERLKVDFVPLAGALDKVRRLQGIRYRFDGAKVDPASTAPARESRWRVGFSAQAVAEVVPEAVRFSAEADRYGVEYAALVPVLVEAIKSQQQQIEALQRRLDAIQARLERAEGHP